MFNKVHLFYCEVVVSHFLVQLLPVITMNNENFRSESYQDVAKFVSDDESRRKSLVSVQGAAPGRITNSGDRCVAGRASDVPPGQPDRCS